MGTQTMGQVRVKAKIENIEDVLNVRAGKLKADAVRFVEIDDALVDTGAKFVSLPHSLIQRLGLYLVAKRQALTAAGLVPCNLYSTVWPTVNGRQCGVDVSEVPEDCPVLIGVLALEAMDFVVDPGKQRLIGNPAHGGENIIDLL